MSHSSPAIRLTVTTEVSQALKRAKQLYPTLSDPEILKLGLSKVVTNNQSASELTDIRRTTSHAVGHDYLSDPLEDVYTTASGKKVRFS